MRDIVWLFRMSDVLYSTECRADIICVRAPLFTSCSADCVNAGKKSPPGLSPHPLRKLVHPLGPHTIDRCYTAAQTEKCLFWQLDAQQENLTSRPPSKSCPFARSANGYQETKIELWHNSYAHVDECMETEFQQFMSISKVIKKVKQKVNEWEKRP